MTTYCDYCNSHPEDTQYGFPLQEDNLLFERLILEINQASLSWIRILRKADNFRKAYNGFDIEKIASYSEIDRIIRNRLKVNAAIFNAQKIRELQTEYGSFKGWLDANQDLSKEEWIKLFKKTFVFTGGEIVNEFLVSTGYLPGPHDQSCPTYKKVASLQPAWMRNL